MRGRLRWLILEPSSVKAAARELFRAGYVGRITVPQQGVAEDREYFMIAGWALFLHGALTRVDIRLDGRIAGQARIGLPRPDLRSVPELATIPAASLCGFEWRPDPSLLPSHANEVGVGARVTSTDGRAFELSLPGKVRLERPSPQYEETAEHKERLPTRSRNPAGLCRGKDRVGVLAFTHCLDHGGAQRYFFERIRHLMRDPAVSCTVVSPSDGVWRARLEAIGANVHLTEYPTTNIRKYERASAKLAVWAGERNFDVVFVNTLDAFIGADLGDRLGLPVVWAIHESFPLPVWWLVSQGGIGHPRVRTRLEQALSHASSLIFAADATRALFTSYVSRERALTAPYGLELEEIQRFRQRFAPVRAERRRSVLPDDGLLALCLGTVGPRKGQAVLAKAFNEVAADHPRSHIALVGDMGGTYSEAISAYVAEADLDSRFKVVPVTSDPYTWHELADVFVLPSDVESSPISILEAMAFETPVVASSVFGVPELLTDGRDGYLCRPNDVADLARALDRVLSADPDELRRVALAGAERVRQRHDPERYARNFRRIIDQLVDDPHAAPSWEGQAPGEAILAS